MEVLFQPRLELLGAHRFGQDQVHAGGEAAFAV